MTARKEPLKISDHALVRWLDRSGLLDVEALRSALSDILDRAYQAGAAMDAEDFLIVSQGTVFVVREGVLVTMFKDAGRANRSHALAPRADA